MGTHLIIVKLDWVGVTGQARLAGIGDGGIPYRVFDLSHSATTWPAMDEDMMVCYDR